MHYSYNLCCVDGDLTHANIVQDIHSANEINGCDVGVVIVNTSQLYSYARTFVNTNEGPKVITFVPALIYIAHWYINNKTLLAWADKYCLERDWTHIFIYS